MIFLGGFQLIHPLLQSSDLIIHTEESPYEDGKYKGRRDDHQQGLLAIKQQGISAEDREKKYHKKACS